MRSLLHVALLALLAALAACEGESSAGSVEAADFCDEYVDVYCDGVRECCSDDGIVGGSIDVFNCRDNAYRMCEEGLLTIDDRDLAPTNGDAPARIVFDFDEQSAAAALKRMKSAFARCKGDAYVSFADTHYLGEPGSECLRHGDCAEGTRCEHPPLAVFGTCVLAPLEGQECSDICVSWDLTCLDDRGDLICVGPRGKGESCWSAPCEEGLACVATYSDFGEADLRCKEALGEGERCDASDECASYSCYAGRCDPPLTDEELFCLNVSDGLWNGVPLNGIVAP